MVNERCLRSLTLAACLAAGVLLGGCNVGGGPSDADQQRLAKEFSAENVAKELEKQGRTQEAEELRRSAASQE